MKTFTQAIYSYIQKEYGHMFDKILKEENMTQTEIDVLAFLANNPEYKRAQDIVEIRRITKAQASIAVEKLVKKGLLSREVDQNNRRCHILHVEKKAAPIMKKVKKLQHDFDVKAYRGMSQQEIQAYHQLLMKVYNNVVKSDDIHQ
ncbi:winged helix-turn-helix transcriptional regulator [[Clostridium] spiroforme]|nr:winged helix-turn-helix transcriptional regulator [Thomasclavelia spiroformis]MBM6879370.1 winged helix-turn-helix transcriptional regulator [Thomasclavelia spiroformis]MBM6929512.1 winged helix-turn-helix transcriptional regulator [Thomasclavelia spiroformis]